MGVLISEAGVGAFNLCECDRNLDKKGFAYIENLGNK